MENSWKFKRKHKIEGILCPFPVTLKAGTQTKRVDEGRFILGATSKTLTCPLHPSQVPLYNRHKALDAECPYVGDNSPFTEEEQEKPKWEEPSPSIKTIPSEKRWILAISNSPWTPNMQSRHFIEKSIASLGLRWKK